MFNAVGVGVMSKALARSDSIMNVAAMISGSLDGMLWSGDGKCSLGQSLPVIISFCS